MLEIKKVETNKDITKFIDFPHDLYSDDKNYVPELFIQQKKLLDKKINPFFLHSKADLFLAYDNKKIVGRIAAIRNNNYIKFSGKEVGFFGFFDVIDDYKVAKALFETVENWIRKENLNAILGPENFSTNDTCGVLIEGFDLPPAIMMTYNKPYYAEFIEKYGFKKRMDLLAYNLITKNMPEKILQFAKSVENRLNKKGIIIRTVNLKDFWNEVKKIKDVYNSAWEKNWGFVPMTDEEFMHTAKDLKSIINPKFAFVAECNGKIIGYSLSLPDINQILIHIKRGRLFPFGIFKLLFGSKLIKTVRIITLGVIEEFRKSGIDVCFYAKTIEAAKNNNIYNGEASWILETNEMMNKALITLNGYVYKKYRIYEKNL